MNTHYQLARSRCCMINHHIRNLFLIFVLATLCGCHSMPKPGVSMANAHFAEGPVIIQRGEHFYLRYRIALEQDRFRPFQLLLREHKTKDAGYFYFDYPGDLEACLYTPREWGALVERPLACNGLEDLAREGKVYWLDRDGTPHLLRIQSDK